MGELQGQAKRGAASRAAILEAATAVFAKRGFRGGALTEVASLVGMTPAGILYHFGSKEALLLAVIRYRDERAAALEVPATEGTSALESLIGLVRFAQMAEDEPGLAALHTVLQIENLDAADPAYEYFQTRSRRSQAWVRETLRQAEAAGELKPGVDVEATMLEIMSFLEGVAVVWLMNPERSIVDMYRSYLVATVDELRARPARARRAARSQPTRST